MDTVYNMTEFHLWVCFRLEIRAVHRYGRPGTFAVAAQCSSADINITAHKVISIHRPVTAFAFLTCYAGNLSFSASNCKAVHGEQLQIQINAGRCQYDSNLTSFTIYFENVCFCVVVRVCLFVFFIYLCAFFDFELNCYLHSCVQVQR